MENAYCGAWYYILFFRSDQTNGDEVGRVCTRHQRDEKCVNNLALKNWREIITLTGQIWMNQKNHLSHDDDNWWAQANIWINLGFHKTWEILWLAQLILVSKEGICSAKVHQKSSIYVKNHSCCSATSQRWVPTCFVLSELQLLLYMA
jgi:hypothetical protein